MIKDNVDELFEWTLLFLWFLFLKKHCDPQL